MLISPPCRPRLAEPQHKEPSKYVVTLRALLDSVESNLTLFTRENFICNDRLPYDCQGVYYNWIEKSGFRNNCGALPNEGPEAWCKSDLLHKEFDKLSGVKPDSRSRLDLIKPHLITNARDRLAICDNVRTYTHKFIAHAADPNNRHQLIDEEEKLTLKNFEDCYKSIYFVAEFIGRIVGKGTCICPIPVPQYDHLKHLDKSFALPRQLDIIRLRWESRSKDIEAWENDLWPE